MARRRRRSSRRTRTVTRYARSARRRSKGLLGGINMQNIMWGGGARVAKTFIPQFLGKWTNPVAFGAGALLLKKPQLWTIAGYEAADAFLGGQTSAGGFWEG